MCKLEKVPNGPAAGCFFEGSFAFHLRRPADVAWPDRQGAAAAQPLSVNWRRHVCCHLSFGWQARALARLVGKSQQQLAGSGAGKESLGLSGSAPLPLFASTAAAPFAPALRLTLATLTS